MKLFYLIFVQQIEHQIIYIVTAIRYYKMLFSLLFTDFVVLF